jgi:hypothetical protein
MPNSSASDLIPPTTQRVPQHTNRASNDRIARHTEANLAHFAANPQSIDGRLRQLDREWDIERVLEANAATVSLFGLALGRFVNRTWFLLPAAVAGFLLQHAVQGWCPPVGLFRRLGVRTQREIDEERYALKVMRGDFASDSSQKLPIQEVMRRVRS